MKTFQLHIIEFPVHVLLIMTSYVTITTSLLVLQRYLSAISLHICSIQTPSKVQSSVTRPLQCQYYPRIANGDKDSCLFSIDKALCELEFPCMSMATVDYEPHFFLSDNSD